MIAILEDEQPDLIGLGGPGPQAKDLSNKRYKISGFGNQKVYARSLQIYAFRPGLVYNK